MARMPAAERRSALARAALAVAARDGVAATSTRAIVAEAGMPLASLHYAAGSREELLRDVVGLVVDGEREAAAARLALDAPTVRDAVRSALGGYLDLVRADPGREQAMLELTLHARRSSALADLPGAQYAAYRATVSELLIEAAERYRIRWSRPVDDLARLVVALTDGVTLAWLADADDAAAERMLDLAADAIARWAEDVG